MFCVAYRFLNSAVDIGLARGSCRSVGKRAFTIGPFGKELGPHVRYVLDNPVRKGLVREWREYEFTGAIGMDLETFLQEMGPD